MKKAYQEPFAQKIVFSYQNQVVAASTNYNNGSENNRDNTGKCQQQSYGCNWTWCTGNTVAVSSYSLTDCQELPH